jgi:hypothetical protein
MLFFVIPLFLLITGFVVIHFLSLEKKDKPAILVSKSDIDKEFKEAYLWACDTFGVIDHIFDRLEDNMRGYTELGYDYFVYYYASEYLRYYPKYIPKPKTKVTSSNRRKDGIKFAQEFIDIVNDIRASIDTETLTLMSKYDVDYKKLLTNKFEVDNMQLFNPKG